MNISLKELWLLLNKKILFVLSFAVLLFSCGKDKTEDNNPDTSVDSIKTITDNSIRQQAEKILNTKVNFFAEGKFINNENKQFVAGVETANKKVWGINFYFFEQKNDSLAKFYETPLMGGSFEKSEIKVTKINNSETDLVYYNSKSFFMGNDYGEVFAYIINPKENKVYKSHLYTEDGATFNIYLSEDKNTNQYSSYLYKKIASDYTNTTIVVKDKILE